jgi:hypothetical protein
MSKIAGQSSMPFMLLVIQRDGRFIWLWLTILSRWGSLLTATKMTAAAYSTALNIPILPASTSKDKQGLPWFAALRCACCSALRLAYKAESHPCSLLF